MGPPGSSIMAQLAFLLFLVCFKYGLAQIQSPLTNPCQIYDSITGAVIDGLSHIEVVAQETDFSVNKSQRIIVPISGNILIHEITVKEGTTYGLDSGENELGVYFLLEDDYWYLIIPESIDRDNNVTTADDFNYFGFQCLCRYIPVSESQIVNHSIDVVVNIKDSNDNAPQFSQQTYNTGIEELAAFGTTLADLVATDLDANGNRNIIFEMVEGGVNDNGITIFTMSDTTGIIMLKDHLDYETLAVENKTVFTLIIRAKDDPTDPALALSSTATVLIEIYDIDDLSPGFYHPSCVILDQLIVSGHSLEYSTEVTSGTLDVASVLELTPLFDGNNQTSYPMLALDRDALNAAIEFIIVGSFPLEYAASFEIETAGPIADHSNSLHGRDVYQASLRQIGVIQGSEVPEILLMIQARQIDDPLHKYTVTAVRVIVNGGNVQNVVMSDPIFGNIRESDIRCTNVKSIKLGQKQLTLTGTNLKCQSITQRNGPRLVKKYIARKPGVIRQ